MADDGTETEKMASLPLPLVICIVAVKVFSISDEDGRYDFFIFRLRCR